MLHARTASDNVGKRRCDHGRALVCRRQDAYAGRLAFSIRRTTSI